jgi:hypothetical protein
VKHDAKRAIIRPTAIKPIRLALHYRYLAQRNVLCQRGDGHLNVTKIKVQISSSTVSRRIENVNCNIECELIKRAASLPATTQSSGAVRTSHSGMLALGADHQVQLSSRLRHSTGQLTQQTILELNELIYHSQRTTICT